MKKIRTLMIWVAGAVFCLSLFFIIYSSIQLLTTNSKITTTLEEWEENKVNYQKEESPVSIVEPLNVSVEDDQLEENLNDTVEEEIITPFVYETRPNVGDVFGKIILPSLDEEYPIISGTDQKELAKGVGHYTGSVLPGEHDNSVLAGHRDTVFRRLGEVTLGDVVIVETYAGSFTYEVITERIVDQDDRTVIVPYDEAILTLVTCFPFDYVGAAPERFILTLRLIDNTFY
ncbi:class D sortase [Anaerobacillus sp. MEB173]|uniref:class D sortase n=1 Tax=Anaerobacillus sp. MEB173 TaxID=3383345 RepID=UPI003F8F9307